MTTCKHIVRNSDVKTSRVSLCNASSTNEGITCKSNKSHNLNYNFCLHDQNIIISKRPSNMWMKYLI